MTAIPTARGLPPLKPPYIRITAIDLNTGDHVWVAPGGGTPEAIRNRGAPTRIIVHREGRLVGELARADATQERVLRMMSGLEERAA